MYNVTTRSFTLQDASGSYSWIVENMEAKDNIGLSDLAIYAWIDNLIDLAKDEDLTDCAVRAESQTYPRFGYTTDQVFANADEYLTFKRAEIHDDYTNERATVFAWLKDWIDNALLTTLEAAAYVNVQPLTIKRWTKAGSLKPAYHQTRFNLYTKRSLDQVPRQRKPRAPRAQS